jgi:RNA polymerase sigma factor (sigma-70 family)
MHLIEEHYHKNRRLLVKRMSFRAGDSAEDIVQEAYARALRYYGSFKQDKLFDAWFRLILNNAFKEHMNNEKGFAAVEFEEDNQEGVVCNQFSARVVAEIYDLIATKSVVQIEVLTYHLQQGYTAKEVSEITEFSYAACHQIILRFKQELRELYGKD